MKTAVTKAILFTSLPSTLAFVPPASHRVAVGGKWVECNTALKLDDDIANMIDNELYRLHHKRETDDEWLRKQREWAQMEPQLPAEFDFEDADGVIGASVHGFTSGVDRTVSSPQRRKDERMAENDPMRYCADRCVTTGNCDVFEDMFEMGPEEVVKFCNECVLSEDEEPCDIPASVFDDNDDDNSRLQP